MPKKHAEEEIIDDESFVDDEPLPAKRDTSIFHRKKESQHKDDDFDEDVFV
jgi:hypothetical protein